VALVEQGRTIYQRILTWTISKISRTILKAAFVAVAFVVTTQMATITLGVMGPVRLEIASVLRSQDRQISFFRDLSSKLAIHRRYTQRPFLNVP